jgi:mRNA interferase RelE/StbE
LAALIPVEDLTLLEALEDRLDVWEAEKALAKSKAKGERPIPWEKAKKTEAMSGGLPSNHPACRLASVGRHPKPDQRHIRKKIDGLSDEPYPPGAKKLHGKHEFFRLRSGNYRIVYTVEHERLIVLVVRIGHRREVYRNL